MPKNGYDSQLELQASQNGFSSTQDYLDHLTQKGKEADSKYKKHLLRIHNRREYKKLLAEEKGYISDYAYKKRCLEQRTQRKENRELSDLIKTQLKQLGKTKIWLAREVGISKVMVHNYCSGRNMPSPHRMKQLFEILQLPYTCLEQILNSTELPTKD